MKWYPGRPGREAPSLTVTVGAQPEAINLGLSARDAAAASGPVARWVALNESRLLEFWNAGETWDADEVAAFIGGLRKVT